MRISPVLFTICLFFPLFASSDKILVKSFNYTDLYPPSLPYEEGFLQVSPLHHLYYTQFGNPHGVPVLCVHGGPGAGCSSKWSSFFDLSFYRVIMFDQRGAMRSRPFAEMKDNTPQLSVEDMETLRKHLGIERWILFGGSWGSTLSILYGETHPDHVLAFVLRGIFLGRQSDYEHLFYGMRSIFPEAWEEMAQSVPQEERANLMQAIYKRVMNPDPRIHLPIAHAFMRYDTICGTFLPNPQLVQVQALDDRSALSCTRAFVHYSVNHFFLAENQLLSQINRISHLPAILLHGRHDVICLPENAYDLHRKWSNSELWFVPDAGHFSTEPSLAKGLKEAMEKVKEKAIKEQFSQVSYPSLQEVP